VFEAFLEDPMWTPTTLAQHSRSGLRYGSDLTDGEWTILEPFLPPPRLPGDAVIGQQFLKLLTAVLASLIRVVEQRIWFAATPDCHHQRIRDELGGHGGAHRPSDYPA
jgi:hypothetical protein